MKLRWMLVMVGTIEMVLCIPLALNAVHGGNYMLSILAAYVTAASGFYTMQLAARSKP